MGIKRYNLVALLDFPNVIGPKESNPDDETNHSQSLSPCKRMGKSDGVIPVWPL